MQLRHSLLICCDGQHCEEADQGGQGQGDGDGEMVRIVTGGGGGGGGGGRWSGQPAGESSQA